MEEDRKVKDTVY